MANNRRQSNVWQIIEAKVPTYDVMLKNVINGSGVQRTLIRHPQKINQTAYVDVRKTYTACLAEPPTPAAVCEL